MVKKRRYICSIPSYAKKKAYSYERHKSATFAEYTFFDKVKSLLVEKDVYRNFLHGFKLYNADLITKQELLWLAVKFLGKFPSQFRWLKQRLEQGTNEYYDDHSSDSCFDSDKKDQPITTKQFDIDYAAAKRYTVSYRPLSVSSTNSSCPSSANSLYREVLNDFCVSFPSWQSEDSTVVSSKKTLHEECIYRIEDERFGLDIVIEVNKSAIQSLENAKKRMAKMSEAEARFFRFDENFGAKSKVLHFCAIKRIYGEKAPEIIDGLIRNPYIAVPLVLNRLKAKEVEWKAAQKAFNRVWMEQNEQSYSKTIEMQWAKFKQNDLKIIRSKLLLNQIEILYDELLLDLFKRKKHGQSPTCTLLQLTYPAKTFIINDANNILFSYIEKNLSDAEIAKVKQFFGIFLMFLNVYTDKTLARSGNISEETLVLLKKIKFLN